MEDEIRNILQAISKIETRLNSIDREIGNIMKEVGVGTGELLRRQMDKIMLQRDPNSRTIEKIEREVMELRKSVDSHNNEFRDIKQALAVIYRNTDELESNLVRGPRKTT